jgi:hypothetical protein
MNLFYHLGGQENMQAQWDKIGLNFGLRIVYHRNENKLFVGDLDETPLSFSDDGTGRRSDGCILFPNCRPDSIPFGGS